MKIHPYVPYALGLAIATIPSVLYAQNLQNPLSREVYDLAEKCQIPDSGQETKYGRLSVTQIGPDMPRSKYEKSFTLTTNEDVLRIFTEREEDITTIDLSIRKNRPDTAEDWFYDTGLRGFPSGATIFIEGGRIDPNIIILSSDFDFSTAYTIRLQKFGNALKEGCR